jgi:uncharacterized iron-regulated protein
MMTTMSLRDVSRTGSAASLLVVALVAVALAGCRRGAGRVVARDADESRFGIAGVDAVTQTRYGQRDITIHLSETDEDLWVFDGHTGEPMTGRRLLEDFRTADVIILGEMHDDPMAHLLQERFVREALAAGDGALSLEMIGRQDQAVLNGLRNRPGAAEDALADTSLNRWLRWQAFYLPAIEAALSLGRPVIAANAPAEYVRMARNQGYPALRALAEEEQRLFDLPEPEWTFPGYRRRFAEAMSGHGDPASRPATRPSTLPGRERINAHVLLPTPQTRPARESMRAARQQATQPAAPAAPRDSAGIDAFYDAQLLWDATMAQSIINARSRAGTPVVHLVGAFHSDFEGGLTSILTRRGQEVLTVSFVPTDAQQLAPEDVGRADVVIYTGSGRPLPPERAPATRPATQPRVLGQTPPVVGRGPAAPATVPATRPTTRRSAGG